MAACIQFYKVLTLAAKAAATFIATQRDPSTRLINLYFPAAAKGTRYTWTDHARILAHRRATSREECGTFTLSTMQVRRRPLAAAELALTRSPPKHLFGSGNASLTQIVVGGDLSTLRPWLGSGGYEYLVPGYEPQCLHVRARRRTPRASADASLPPAFRSLDRLGPGSGMFLCPSVMGS